MIALIENNTKSDKKYDVYVVNTNIIKKISFGAKGYEDYTSHRDKKRKDKYSIRHSNEDWDNPFTAGFWAKNILWNKPTLEDSAKDIEDRYKIKIVLDI